MFRFGCRIYRYDEVTSTQDVARAWVERGAPAGTVVTARQMTRARGRLGREWEHAPGANVGITAIAPPIRPEDRWKVAIAAGLATCAAVNMVAPATKSRVRFPNDVYVDRRKLAGVLIETAPTPWLHDLKDEQVPLVGIGINVLKVPLPPELEERAISLEEASGSAVTVEAMEAALLSSLTRCSEQWRQDGFAALLPAWHERLDPDARRAYVIGGAMVWCRTRSLSPNGIVALEADDGALHQIHAAHVLFGDEP